MEKPKGKSRLLHTAFFIAILGIVLFGAIYISQNVSEKDYQTRLTSIEIDPIASAGEDKEYKIGDSVVLDGSASYDPDGEIIEFQWHAQPENPQIVLPSNANTPRVEFAAQRAGNYRFYLTVTDNSDLSDTDDVIISIVGIE